MISRDALYDFIGDLIENAEIDTPLEGAVLFRNLRSSVDETVKVVRVEAFTGFHAMTENANQQELNVSFVVQTWVIPEGSEQIDIDTAADLSFDMSRVIFEGIASETSLGGRVCDAYAAEFETGEGNLGSMKRGVTYLDGTINEAI